MKSLHFHSCTMHICRSGETQKYSATWINELTAMILNWWHDCNDLSCIWCVCKVSLAMFDVNKDVALAVAISVTWWLSLTCLQISQQFGAIATDYPTTVCGFFLIWQARDKCVTVCKSHNKYYKHILCLLSLSRYRQQSACTSWLTPFRKI